MVFYRKYRPQTINDLDSSQLRETLTSLLQQTPPHAFLFTGPKGLGKTSTARIIAKAVNCSTNYELRIKNQDDLSIEPCNKCSQCLSIISGTNLDVIEIDAASNRGIDEIRDLKEKIRLAPVSAHKKIYIIDEVHMLTTEAFNALLKTLEEPPSHALFVLCTTEAHKIPATILSRCFHLSFQPATTKELVRSFRRIAQGEQLDITDEVLEMIAELADRGFRDGVKILEELVSLSNGKALTKEFVEEKYRVSSSKHQVSQLVIACKEKDAKKGLEIIAAVVAQGGDMRHFVQQLMEELHHHLLIQTGVEKASLSHRELIFTVSEIQHLFVILSHAYQEMKFAVLPQLPLELAIITYCQENGAENPVADVVVSEPRVKESKGVTVSSLRKQVGALTAKKVLYGEDDSEEKPVKKPDAEAHVGILHTSPHGAVTKEWQDALWRGLLDELKKHNHTIAGVLRSCAIKSYDRQELIIETAFTFHKERLDDPKVHGILAEACKMLTGKEVSVRVELKK